MFIALSRQAHALVLAAGEPVDAAWLAARLGLDAPGAPRLLARVLDGRFRVEPHGIALWAWERPFPAAGETVVVLDIEATGGHPERDEIIEVAAVRLAPGGAYHEFQALCDPGRPIPPFIQGLTGITDVMVRGAPPLASTLERLLELAVGSTLVIQNARFDLSFLNARFATLDLKLTLPVVDTIDLARRALPGRRRRGLDALAWAYGIEIQDRHRALGDARATLAVARELHRSLAAGRDISLCDLHQESLPHLSVQPEPLPSKALPSEDLPSEALPVESFRAAAPVIHPEVQP